MEVGTNSRNFKLRMTAVSTLLVLLYTLRLVLGNDSFPAALTKENFQLELASGLHLVEFYSPYCSHCKSFAPTWEKTWQTFHSEGLRIGIGMVQVNCVESGDLCNEEKITAYPALKLYGPEGFIKNYPKSYQRTEDDIIRFCKDQVLELADDKALPESHSELISSEFILKLLEKPTEIPYLISFWPSYELHDLNVIDETKFTTPFQEETLDFQRKWRIISNQLASLNVTTGHFNCLSNQKICNSLGFRANRPGVGLILPDLISGKFITYDQSVYKLEPKQIIEFLERITTVSKVPTVGTGELVTSNSIPTRLPLLSFLPQSSETYFVFLYDNETVSNEDFEILPYLIEPLSQLPHTQLRKSSDLKLLDLIELQKRNIYRSLNYNASETPREFNEQRYLLETSTTLPTLLCFKQHSILPEIFHSHAPHDIRDHSRVIDWIKDNAQQSISELNSASFTQNLKSLNRNQKLIVQLINTKDEESALSQLSNFITASHDYYDLSLNHIYEETISERGLTDAKIEKLKESAKVKSKDIVQPLLERIDYKKKENINSVYLDLHKSSNLLADLGVSVDEEFGNGDVIIFDDNKKFYYTTDPFGSRLSTKESPYFLRETLAVLSKIHKGSIKKNLRNSPYGSGLRFLDHVHQFGISGYIFVLIALLCSVKIGSIVSRRRFLRKRESRRYGILDDSTKFE
jgi:protein disulfide-isomerase